MIQIGILAVVFTALCGIAAIAENWSAIWKRICSTAFRIRLFFWRVQTAYYQFKLDRRRRRYYR